jgi:phosphatidylglycerol:prolipoprotein diacylglycerol transferase
MIVHPQFDPIALKLGPVAVRWYGLMYLAGFVVGLMLGRHRARSRPDLGWSLKDVDDLLFYAVIGVVLGGRLGYVLFYKFADYLQEPLRVLYVWEGGMSFHGGFLGVIIAMAWFARRRRLSWLAVTDFIAPLTPAGLGFGRIGNFINAELWGRPTDVPWAVVFPNVDNVARHPSQLYEAALEGAVLFALLWWFSSRPRPRGAVSGLFLSGYGLMRFIAEFAREPDDFLGFLAMGLTMGQWLSLPMVASGLILFFWSCRSNAGMARAG